MQKIYSLQFRECMKRTGIYTWSRNCLIVVDHFMPLLTFVSYGQKNGKGVSSSILIRLPFCGWAYDGQTCHGGIAILYVSNVLPRIPQFHQWVLNVHQPLAVKTDHTSFRLSGCWWCWLYLYSSRDCESSRPRNSTGIETLTISVSLASACKWSF